MYICAHAHTSVVEHHAKNVWGDRCRSHLSFSLGKRSCVVLRVLLCLSSFRVFVSTCVNMWLKLRSYHLLPPLPSPTTLPHYPLPPSSLHYTGSVHTLLHRSILTTPTHCCVVHLWQLSSEMPHSLIWRYNVHVHVCMCDCTYMCIYVG